MRLDLEGLSEDLSKKYDVTKLEVPSYELELPYRKVERDELLIESGLKRTNRTFVTQSFHFTVDVLQILKHVRLSMHAQTIIYVRLVLR